MIKYFALAGLLLSLNTLQAQMLSFDHGKIELYTASVLSDIDGVTEKANVKLDIQTGNIEVTIDIKSFEFEYELMQEHFNEKYMESDKFPQAIFKGKISQDISVITDELKVDATGELTIHGVTRKIEVKAIISKKEGYTIVKSKIPVVFKNYKVDEPSILTKSIAKDVEIKSTFYLK
ncbi:MAG: YceI family protein [Bacteroidetes bacterium]|nr:YceI family protein [Bacteroidota bacterium]